ncbi:GerMN domain-containing protein [Bacillus sp. FJAT-50079]|uniref:GerMN domain-containing protein n=1 Tax=Bacillus sp. FJAT-50079 TaxID=2833577 RepID=UPI001BC8E190|nr:GerMN domain-containing protein [Bacillus sp. FJAT-50079]MBS4208919.1 GerMN domain-containing protein [Bacillus sp. FJAT-50079]
MAKRTYATATVVIAATCIISAGCGLFGKEKEKLDPPKVVTQLKEGEQLDASPDTETSGEEAAKTVMTDLYFIDQNGYVVSQTLALPMTEGPAKQALEYLVADGKVMDILPNGFRTVLPAGTEVDVDIKDGKAIVNFSEEFGEYAAEDEKKILEAVTWTLTQFDSVKSVELRVNGYKLEEMPVNGTPINENGLTREVGINTGYSDTVDLTNTRPLTVYYLSQGVGEYYYVPVTERVSNKMKDDLTATVNELIEGPGLQTGLISGLSLMSDLKLLEDPTMDDEGVVTLNFNEAVMAGNEENVISNEVLQSLVLSLTEQAGVESVSVLVNGKSELVNEDGEALTAPVTRPEKINVGSF